MTIHSTAITFHDCRIHLEPIGPEPGIPEQRYRFHVEHCASTEAILGTAIRQWVIGKQPASAVTKTPLPETKWVDGFAEIAALRAEVDRLRIVASENGKSCLQQHDDITRMRAEIRRLIDERDEARQMHRERVFYDRASLEGQLADMGARLTKLRAAAQSVAEIRNQTPMPIVVERIDELRKALS